MMNLAEKLGRKGQQRTRQRNIFPTVEREAELQADGRNQTLTRGSERGQSSGGRLHRLFFGREGGREGERERSGTLGRLSCGNPTLKEMLRAPFLHVATLGMKAKSSQRYIELRTEVRIYEMWND